MQLTLRPYATAGVALAAAGVIAVAPVAPPPPAIQVSAPRIASEAVQLATYPLDLTTVYTDLLSDTFTSLQGLGTLLKTPSLQPIPIVQQLFVNAGGYFVDVVTDPLDAFFNAVFSTTPTNLVDAVTELLDGNFSAALQSLATAVSAPIVAPVEQFITGVTTIATSIVTHVTNLITALPTLGQLALTGIVGVPVAAFDGVEQAVENVVQAIAANDAAGVLTALLAAPGVFLDEVLNANGGTAVGTAQGLLSSNGPIGAVLQIRNTIATALDGPSSSSQGQSSSSQGSSSSSSQAAAEATPTTTANTVTLNVAATPASTTPVTPKTSTTPVTSKTPTTPTVPAATTGTSGINVSPTSTPGSHPTTMKTVIGQLNSTVNTVGGLGATQHGGKTTKK